VNLLTYITANTYCWSTATNWNYTYKECQYDFREETFSFCTGNISHRNQSLRKLFRGVMCPGCSSQQQL